MEPTDTQIKEALEGARTVAVLGASANTEKPANYVPRYLAAHGYELLPVNASTAGSDLFGATVTATLAELPGPVDVVDVFRRPADIPPHVPDILAMNPLPKVVWFQLGIRNDEAATQLEAAGIRVVQDKCIKVEHARLLGGKRAEQA